MKEAFHTYVMNPLVDENAYRTMPPDTTQPPTFEQARHLLPQPFWLEKETGH